MSERDKKFEDPQLAINRVYTRKGDSGQTSLVGGQRVPKTAARIDSYGTVDELNAIIGMCRQTLIDEHGDNDAFDELAHTLLRVQHELFNLGSILATLPEDIGEKMPRVDETDVAALEASIDKMNEELPELRSFVLPGGSRLNAELHLGRTVCRRAERKTVALAETEEVDPNAIAYLNRLSDALFVWSRWAAVKGSGADEVLWDPNLSAGSSA
ncbi:cob(I)yrinic acid a,c-diamide adenosyltransferase [Persicimonas caeni]|uniref:Corrinoid adenosyltransferase n=1 Tax=Persicimonas caeni TaxID=2292766 RepID=A0A4Y6PWC7_PERCE|nr:cob(I)yrinic acid a,c-diamide adenosyltransferase [Persicimonas caeni]QDG52439.1 cob(I)yrinic acid a,c-diamide adenosyltransferase [Persicimonas caeni]QED33661.1 cob(I)yrinic acid a,c-diamide adenosyltransferase [Persicimonas caeni]